MDLRDESCLSAGLLKPKAQRFVAVVVTSSLRGGSRGQALIGAVFGEMKQQ